MSIFPLFVPFLSEHISYPCVVESGKRAGLGSSSSWTRILHWFKVYFPLQNMGQKGPLGFFGSVRLPFFHSFRGVFSESYKLFSSIRCPFCIFGHYDFFNFPFLSLLVFIVLSWEKFTFKVLSLTCCSSRSLMAYVAHFYSMSGGRRFGER